MSGIEFNISTDTFAKLITRLKAGAETLFTMNIDHMRILQIREDFRQAYQQASAITFDSNFFNRAYLGNTFPVVTGSDLVQEIVSSEVFRDSSIIIVGNLAQQDAQALFKNSHISVLQPSMGFLSKPDEINKLSAKIADLNPAMIFLAVGAPQSEILAHKLRLDGIKHSSIVCCGAAFEFLIGEQKRAPQFMQQYGVEWAWRLGKDPKRLWKRYASDALFLVQNHARLAKGKSQRHIKFPHFTIRFDSPPSIATLDQQ